MKWGNALYEMAKQLIILAQAFQRQASILLMGNHSRFIITIMPLAAKCRFRKWADALAPIIYSATHVRFSKASWPRPSYISLLVIGASARKA